MYVAPFITATLVQQIMQPGVNYNAMWSTEYKPGSSMVLVSMHDMERKAYHINNNTLK